MNRIEFLLRDVSFYMNKNSHIAAESVVSGFQKYPGECKHIGSADMTHPSHYALHILL
jgi:hypothetical protein